MLRGSCWLVLAFGLTINVWGSTETRALRYSELALIKKQMPAFNLEVYERELKYEEQNLSFQTRARIEANRISESIKSQVFLMYKKAMERKGSETEATEEIIESIHYDLGLVAPEFREDIRQIALNALEQARSGAVLSQDARLENLEERLKASSMVRSQFLNLTSGFEAVKDYNQKIDDSVDQQKRIYKNIPELMESLTSPRESTDWISSAGLEISSDVSRSTEGKISFQFKTRFLGAEIEAGPVINVQREISTTARIQGEGQYPFLRPDGNFDFTRKDRSGKAVLLRNGKYDMRFISFNCSARLEFRTEVSAGGGFTYLGLGGNVNVVNHIQDNVQMDSRRVLLPESIEGKTVTMPLLRQLCHRDYLRAKVFSNLTVRQSLEVNMKSLLSGAIFVHPRTTCGVDAQCVNWYKKEKINLLGKTAYPRCAETKEHFKTCIAAALKDQSCPVYVKGKLVSRGNENICDRGLKCAVVKAAGPLFFQYAQGKCVPASANYRAPKPIR